MEIIEQIQKEAKQLAKIYRPGLNVINYQKYLKALQNSIYHMFTEYTIPETFILQKIPAVTFDTASLISLNIQETATEPTVLKDFLESFC
ncbi:MAG: hypothetical protein LBC03_03605 [Nitrososphaerota archaeon]|jgi:hypothetical protein|nr:hypothetical protein [Nitrososphaerota archaeon]